MLDEKEKIKAVLDIVNHIETTHPYTVRIQKNKSVELSIKHTLFTREWIMALNTTCHALVSEYFDLFSNYGIEPSNGYPEGRYLKYLGKAVFGNNYGH